MSTNKSDFYVGYMPEAAPAFAKKSRRFVWVLLAIVPLIGLGLAVSQRGFPPAVFEFGTLTQIEGELVMAPVPLLRTLEEGHIKHILLVGAGKMGAEYTFADWEKDNGVSLEGKRLVLNGTRIYHNGKMALELTEGVASIMRYSESVPSSSPNVISLGEVSLKGEILDPKCALGVMNPAEGKPHRSCAIRCIAGGIPPMLRITNNKGETNYILVKGRDKKDVNASIIPYVADQIQICGRLVQQDDWLVLYSDPASEIQRLAPFIPEGQVAMCGR